MTNAVCNQVHLWLFNFRYDHHCKPESGIPVRVILFECRKLVLAKNRWLVHMIASHSRYDRWRSVGVRLANLASREGKYSP